jgi:methylmalonyl-CoA mutase
MKDKNLPADFFAEFPPVGREEWLQYIAKSLKDKPLEAFDWYPADGLKVSPFAHADDLPVPPLPLSDSPNNWEICEDIIVNDIRAANRQALEALEGGAEGLTFFFDSLPATDDFSVLFDGIFPDYIGLHFAGPGVTQNPGAILANLERLAAVRDIPVSQLHGSLHFDPAASSGIIDWRYLADLIGYAQTQLPGFRVITLALGHDVAGLGADLRRANQYLEKLAERGVPAEQTAAQMQFSMPVGKRYFLEIARIRAFKLLWLNVLKGWSVAPEYPVVSARFRADVYTDDLHTNMIAATTMAMSVVLGGTDRLTVLPFDAGREGQSPYPQAFSRRIAGNVQQLLKLESGLVEVADPAAGSYYIEQLTRQLAEKAWEAFGA